MRLRSSIGAGVIAFGLVVPAAAPSAPAAGRSHARAAGGTYFYAHVGNSVPGTKSDPNPPQIKPSTLVENNDGSWLIVNLRWTGWGGSTARAAGISSASSCKPSCAIGKRTHDAAKLVVSQPKRLLGRTVYTCFQLTIPAAPKANEHKCLGRSGGVYFYEAAAGSNVGLTSFLSPNKKIWCVLSDVPGAREAGCYTGPPTSSPTPTHSALVSASGRVHLCNWTPGQNSQLACVQNWDPDAPVLRPGYIDLVYRYRCTSTTASVTCTVATGPGKGNGFRITPTSVTKLTP